MSHVSCSNSVVSAACNYSGSKKGTTSGRPTHLSHVVHLHSIYLLYIEQAAWFGALGAAARRSGQVCRI